MNTVGCQRSMYLRTRGRSLAVRRRFIPAATLVLLMLAAALPQAQGAPFAPTFPAVYVNITPLEPVDVSADGEQNITANGTVSVTLFSFVETRVNLTAEVHDTFWSAEIAPISVTLTGSGTIPFTVNITVPGHAPAGTATVLFVNANVSTTNYPVGRDFDNQTPIPILQYYGVALTAATPSSPERFDAAAAAETSFAFRLQNTGNGADSFEISVLNLAELQASGISVDIPSPVSGVGKGVTVIQSGKVTLPPSVALQDFPLQIQASSAGALGKGLTATGATTKTIHAVAALPDGGNNGTGNNTTEPPKGFLPGMSVPLAVGALGVAAVAAAWRRLRPPSQGEAYRGSPDPSRARAP